MGKENVVYAHDGILLGHKNGKILSFVPIWINLEDVVLNEISQEQKDKYFLTHQRQMGRDSSKHRAQEGEESPS
jgi:hypothetical protein